MEDQPLSPRAAELFAILTQPEQDFLGWCFITEHEDAGMCMEAVEP
jgi:hypothetical protein